MIQVKRVTAGASFAPVEFDHRCSQYLVKNFSEGDIYVATEADATEDTSIKIPAGSYQVCITNAYLNADCFKVDRIYIKGSGEVEVQQLCWKE